MGSPRSPTECTSKYPTPSAMLASKWAMFDLSCTSGAVSNWYRNGTAVANAR